jgi:hypothetical protein
MPDGRRTRECSDYKRLAVLLLPSLTARLLGSPLLEPVFLRVPPASLNDLGVFGDRMNAMGWHYSSFVTRASFDPSSEYPKFKFEEVQALTDGEAPVVLPMRDEPQTLRITGEDKTTAIPGAARPLLAAASVESQKQITQNVDTGLGVSSSQVSTASTATRQEATPNSAPLSRPLDTPTQTAAQVTTGLGFATTASPSKPVPDTGETVESDSDLDAEINSILGL